MPESQQEQLAYNPKQEISRFDFRGGISRTRRQSPNQVYFVKNASPKADGTLEVRMGQTLHASVGDSYGSFVSMYGRYNTADGLNIFSIKKEDDINDKAYKDTTNLTGITLTATDEADIFEYKNVVFFTNGTDAIFYHVMGTSIIASVTGSPTPPVGQTGLIYKDRMYIGLADGNVQWSDVGVYDTLPTVDFPALNFQPVGSTGNGVTKLLAGQDFLTAFTSKGFGIMLGSPDDDGGLGDMSWQDFPGVGCLHPKHATLADRTIYFLGSNSRMYALNGTSIANIDPLGYIQEYLDLVPSTLNSKISLKYWNNELWIFLPQTSNLANGITLVYSEVYTCWYVFDNIRGNIYTEVSTINQQYVGSVSDGSIWRQNHTEYDLGSRIGFDFISRQEPLGTFILEKIYEVCTAMAELLPGDSLAFSYALDNTPIFTSFTFGTPISVTGVKWGVEKWGVSIWGGKATRIGRLRPAEGIRMRGREIRFRATGSLRGGSKLLNYSIRGTIIPRLG